MAFHGPGGGVVVDTLHLDEFANVGLVVQEIEPVIHRVGKSGAKTSVGKSGRAPYTGECPDRRIGRWSRPPVAVEALKNRVIKATAVSIRPWRIERAVRLHARRAPPEHHQPGAAEPATTRLAAPETQPLPPNLDDRRQVESHDQPARIATGDHVPPRAVHSSHVSHPRVREQLDPGVRSTHLTFEALTAVISQRHYFHHIPRTEAPMKLIAVAFLIITLAASANAFEFAPKRKPFTLSGKLIFYFPAGKNYHQCYFVITGRTNDSDAKITSIKFPDGCFGVIIPNLPWRVEIANRDTLRVTHISLASKSRRECWTYRQTITVNRSGIWSFSPSLHCRISGSLTSSPAIRIKP
jgi:hypothetical protein